MTIRDVHVFTRNRIDPIGVHPIVVVEDTYSGDKNLFAELKVECPTVAIAYRDILD